MSVLYVSGAVAVYLGVLLIGLELIEARRVTHVADRQFQRKYIPAKPAKAE
jgi:hypothetical protein